MTSHGLKFPDNMIKLRLRWDTGDKSKNLVQSMLSYNSDMESEGI